MLRKWRWNKEEFISEIDRKESGSSKGRKEGKGDCMLLLLSNHCHMMKISHMSNGKWKRLIRTSNHMTMVERTAQH